MNDTTGHNTVTVTRVEVIDAIETAFKKAPLTKEDLVAAAEHAGVRRPIIELLERLPRRIYRRPADMWDELPSFRSNTEHHIPAAPRPRRTSVPRRFLVFVTGWRSDVGTAAVADDRCRVNRERPTSPALSATSSPRCGTTSGTTATRPGRR